MQMFISLHCFFFWQSRHQGQYLHLHSTLVAENCVELDFVFLYMQTIISLQFLFCQSHIYFIRDNLCSLLQWQRFVYMQNQMYYDNVFIHVDVYFSAIPFFAELHISYQGQSLQSTLVAENYVDMQIQMYCDVHFPCFSRVSYLVGDNVCSSRQWQRIMLTCRFRCIVMYIFPVLAE